MKTVQMTLDDELVEEVDQAVGELRTTRSAFARDALRAALQRHREAGLEEKHRRGYELHPVSAEEFSVWEGEQEWGDS
ncbi:MAG: ribbon-helix-helix domain-containing protein [Deferrisomatales bacterium]